MCHSLLHIGSFFRRYSIVLMLWCFVYCFVMDVRGQVQDPCDTPPIFDVRTDEPTIFLTGDNINVLPEQFVQNPPTHNCYDVELWFVIDGKDQSFLTFYCNHIGTQNVFIVAEANGIRSDPKMVTFHIADHTLPVINCTSPVVYPSGKDYYPTDSTCTAIGHFTITASDNCTPADQLVYSFIINDAGSISDINSFDFPVGTNHVTFTVKDASGNESLQCSFNVMVKDEQKPEAICKGTDTDPVIITLDALTGTANIDVSDIDGGSWDNCTPPEKLFLSLDKEFFNCNDLDLDTTIVILTVKDNAKNTASCKATVSVQYDPSLNPPIVLSEEEICSGNDAELELTHPDFSSLDFRWSWNMNAPLGITASGGLTGHTIHHTFANANDAVGQVTYTVTPSIRYGYGNRCMLTDIEQILLVNPHPKLIHIDDATICNETETPIPVRKSPVSILSNNAYVYFHWEVTSNSVAAQASSDEYQVNLSSSISQTLVNQDVKDEDVTYTLIPSLHLNGRVDGCPSLHNETVTITVMPTPVIDIAVSGDTICNEQTINFTVNSQNVISKNGTWKSDLITAGPGISISPVPALSLQQNAPPFNQTITNNTDNGQMLNYTFTPQIEIAQNGIHCYAPEKTVTVPIRVNPTPKMTAQIPHLPQLCYGDGAQIDLESPNYNIFGSLKYDLDVDYAVGELLYVIDPSFSINYTNITATIIQPTFQNESDIPQTVTYKIYPFIQINSSLQCSGEPVESSVHQAPKLIFDMVADTVYGGYNIRCYGETNGKISIENTSGGWSAEGYDYEWSANVNAGNNTTALTGLPAEKYSITIRDKVIGCVSYKEITLKQPEILRLLQPDIIRPDCRFSDGSITVNATGGTKSDIYPYKYEWIAPDIFEYFGEINRFENLKTGKYTITVIDTNQCKTSATYDLPYTTDIDNFIMGNWRASNYGPDMNDGYYTISCYGANNGVLDPNPSGRMASAYTWKYNSEVYKDSIASGGTYFTALTNDFRISDLAAGVYELTIIDISGCELVSEPFEVTQPSPITFNELVPKHDNNYEVQCVGDKNGSIIITDVAGAFGGKYEYRWNKSDGDLSDIVQGASEQTALGAGTYELSIINKFDCKTTVTHVLTEPSELIVKETIPNKNGFEIQCYGEHTGSINLNVSGGGEGTYNYQWSTSDGFGLKPQNQNQNGLSPGTYMVDIGYSNGLCVKTEQYELKSPQRIENDSIVSGIKCYGDNNASIQINITGGVPSYTYLWNSSDGILSDPGVQNQYNLTPGIYQLKVTDANNCVKLETYTLMEPDPVNPDLEVEDMSCYPGNDGYIKANTSGGTPGYTYLWSHGFTIDEITGLLPGTYSVTVTDANGCTGAASADIHIPLPLQVTAVAVSNFNTFHIDCYGNETGKIELKIENGRGGYIYTWSSGDTTEKIDYARAGDYSVTVTDRFNCTGNASTTLIQPDRLWGQSIITDVVCPGDNSGNILALVGGGVEPYCYHWSNDAENTPHIDHLTAGTYQVQITDNNNCFLDLQATIVQPSEFKADFTLTDAFCPETSDGDIRSVVSGGTPPYTYQWQDIAWGTSPNIADLRSGVYSLEVTDAMSCKYLKTVELGYNSTDCLRIPNAFSPNDDGSNDSWEIFVGDPNSSFRYQLREVYPNAIVEVYSGNWGMLLYRSQRGYPEPWDGKFQGKYLPVNSYVYRIILNNHTKPVTGNVTIIR